jgi:hypothetical protein
MSMTRIYLKIYVKECNADLGHDSMACDEWFELVRRDVSVVVLVQKLKCLDTNVVIV